MDSFASPEPQNSDAPSKARPSRKRKRGKAKLATLGVAAAVVGGAFAATLSANANANQTETETAQTLADEDPPTDQELLDACQGADVCQYNVTSTSRYPGPEHVVGDIVINCEPETVTRNITWSDTTKASANVNLSLAGKVGFLSVLNASFTASLGVGFESSHTTSESFTETLRPFSKSEVVRAAPMMATVGDWELHFPSRFHGHFIWFDRNVVIEAEDSNGAGFIVFRQRALTQAEIDRDCTDFANAVAPEPFEEEKIISALTENGSKPGGSGRIEPGDAAAAPEETLPPVEDAPTLPPVEDGPADS
ncbi:hypothetical protein [Streptomyces sp. NPDC002845]